MTASFGRILPYSLLGLFAPSRRLNVHPSALPAYRGAAPIQHTLIDGRTETGVCVIEMMERRKGIDAGEIWGMRTMVSSTRLCASLRRLTASFSPSQTALTSRHFAIRWRWRVAGFSCR